MTPTHTRQLADKQKLLRKIGRIPKEFILARHWPMRKDWNEVREKQRRGEARKERERGERSDPSVFGQHFMHPIFFSNEWSDIILGEKKNIF